MQKIHVKKSRDRRVFLSPSDKGWTEIKKYGKICIRNDVVKSEVKEGIYMKLSDLATGPDWIIWTVFVAVSYTHLFRLICVGNS